MRRRAGEENKVPINLMLGAKLAASSANPDTAAALLAAATAAAAAFAELSTPGKRPFTAD